MTSKTTRIEPNIEGGAGKRATRADATRNRELVFAAAKACFADQGASTSMEEIARRAGVGVGTLYRAFGNRAGLAEAVFRDMLDELAFTATRLTAERDPWHAFVGWLQEFVKQLQSKQTMLSELQPLFDQNPKFLQESRVAAAEGLATVLSPVQRAGLVQNEILPIELIHLISGIGTAVVTSERVDYLLSVIIGGIQVR